MTSATSRPRLEQALRTTLSQLMGSERETSALTDALDHALRGDPQAPFIAARILESYRDDATPNARAQALREHLERALQASGSHESPRARGGAADLRPSPLPDAATPSDANDGAGNLSGTVLKGRFVLKQPIGGGATGVVYRAHDRRPGLHPAQIAVKVLHEELQREQVTLARVRHAFAVNQSLEHPNIAQVYDFYRDEQYGFYTMELLDGESLRRLIELLGPEPLALEEVTPLIRDMGAALTFAHRRGAVHGDFKPENVVVTRDLSPKVLDFGLARAAHAVHRRRGAHAEREVTLTPGYASSEVLAGSDPDASDDVYSFACVCYELLAGHLPFGALNALAARDAGLVPTRIERLADSPWEALSRALALRAQDRNIRVEELVARLCADVRPLAAAPPLLPPPEPPGRPPVAKQRSHGRREHARRRHAGWSRPWLAVALVAGIALAIGASYLALEREARLEQVNAMVASSAEPRSPASEGAEPAAQPDNDDSVKRVTDTASTQPPASAPAVAPSAPSAVPAAEASASAAPAGATAPTMQDAAVSPRDDDSSSRETADTATPDNAFAFPKQRYAASEARSLISIPIERRDGHGAATVVWWTVEGDARAYEDFAYLGRRTESFADGETRLYIHIPVVSDQVAERDEDFYVELASPGGGADGALTRAEVVIRDDDY